MTLTKHGDRRRRRPFASAIVSLLAFAGTAQAENRLGVNAGVCGPAGCPSYGFDLRYLTSAWYSFAVLADDRRAALRLPPDPPCSGDSRHSGAPLAVRG